MDERETDRYQNEYIERFEKDLTITFIVVRTPVVQYSHNPPDLVTYQAVFFSAVGAALTIGTRPDDQTTAFLYAIFFALTTPSRQVKPPS